MKILLVRLRQIGDVVFTTPAVRALRDHFPDAHLTYLVEPAAAPVVAHNTAIDDVVVAPRGRGLSGWRADLAIGLGLRRQRYDLAIDFHGGPRASLLTWLSRARERVGYDVAGRSWMYTTRVGRPRALRSRHSVENQWDLLTALGVPAPDAARYPVEMPVEAAAERSARARLADGNVGPDDRLIVLHVSAGNPFRRWPVEAFGEVASTLAGRMANRRIVVTSGPSDAGAAARVIACARERLAPDARARILAGGDVSLAALRALVDRAALYVGGDSGPMHIAATSHVPIIALYGPTLPARSAPWRAAAFCSVPIEVDDLPCRPCDQRVCLPGDYRCLGRIQPGEVIAAAERLLH